METGIIGLPNVGKSSLFNLLTHANAESQNFPFTTIEPNVGVVAVPDIRLDFLTKTYSSAKVVPATIKFVDIAGLVRGASKGEGLGNQFLGNIRAVDAVVHVVRLFNDENVIHVSGKINPIDDIETINTELNLADIDHINRQLDKVAKDVRSGDKDAARLQMSFKKALELLNDNKPIRSDKALSEELKPQGLLSTKPLIYLINCDAKAPASEIEKIEQIAKVEGSECVRVFVKDELLINDLPEAEKEEYRKEFGLHDSLTEFIQTSYKLLKLITFFTAGPKESHAWPIVDGTKAPQAAGKIHTDFERGFIRALIFNVSDLQKYGSEAVLKEKGLIRTEGREYTVRDGDIVEFLFNV